MGKNFMKDGRWIDKPNKSAILLCTCGNKYIKTREEQAMCVRCISKTKAER